MATRDQIGKDLLSKGATPEQVKMAYEMYREKYGAFDDEKDTYVPPVFSNDEMRDRFTGEDRSRYDQSSDPNGRYARASVLTFMGRYYGDTVDDMRSLELGR